MRNPYVVRNSTGNSRSMLKIGSRWEDMLNADVRRTILSHADRRVEFETKRERLLPEDLVPTDHKPRYKATLAGNNAPAHEDDNGWDDTFEVLTDQKLVFARERHGILGPLTVSFSDCVDERWWGFDAEAVEENNGVLFDPGPVCAAMNYHAEWTGITKIRLPLERDVDSEGRTNWKYYRYEFVREAHNGQQHMVITPPADVFYIDTTYETDERPSAEKTQLVQALVERLHLRHAVVNGVDEFSV
jgi:hypothetical protein